MIDTSTVINEMDKVIPGVVGSVGALLWIQGSWPRKIAMMALGAAASYYAGPHIANVFSMGEGLAGFLVGLFGMSIVDSLFKTWNELGLTELTREFLRSKLGLPTGRGD